MGLRYRHSFKLFPGVRLNLSGGGVSATIGVRGASVNVGRRGVRGNVGIPGTGISFSHRLDGPAPSAARAQEEWPGGDEAPQYYEPPQPARRTLIPAPSAAAGNAIASRATELLTSESLEETRAMIGAAREQRSTIDSELAEYATTRSRAEAELLRRRRSLLRVFMRGRIKKLEDELAGIEKETARLSAWREQTFIDMTFEQSDAAGTAYGQLVRAFDLLRGCFGIWDITTEERRDRRVTRSAAQRHIDRKPVELQFSTSEIVRFDGRAMRFGNANGDDILLYPGVALMPRADGIFALIDLREIELELQGVNFVEEETPPADTKIVSKTWAKVNKDGKPDRRFADNHEIPVCLYAQLSFRSSNGLNEQYQFSNLERAVVFAQAFEAFQQRLRDA